MMPEDIFFQKGDVIFDSESPSKDAYFIMQGSVELELQLGVKSIKIKIGENQFIGDASVVVNQKANKEKLSYRGRAIALEPVHVIPIPVNDIQQELENCPPLLKAWISSFISRVLVVINELSTH